MSTVELPLDVLCAIIQELADDPPALQNCALVSYAFLSPSQRALFNLIELGAHARFNEEVKSLLGLLESSPHIADYVERLHIIESSSFYDMGYGHALNAWENLELSTVISLFQRLRIVVWYSIDPMHAVQWTSVPMALQKCSTVQLLHLVGLGVANSTILVSLFNHLPNIKCFKLERIVIEEQEDAETILQAFQPSNYQPSLSQLWLKRLPNRADELVLGLLEPVVPVSISRLSFLTIENSHVSQRTVARILEAQEGPNLLETLALDFSLDAQFDSPSFHLGYPCCGLVRFTALKSFTVTILPTQAPWLCNALYVPNGQTSSLESIYIRVMLQQDSDYGNCELWSNIDTVLAKPMRFPGLTSVKFVCEEKKYNLDSSYEVQVLKTIDSLSLKQLGGLDFSFTYEPLEYAYDEGDDNDYEDWTGNSSD